MFKLYPCVIGFLLVSGSLFGQSSIQHAINEAELKYKNIPKGLLPAMAYAASRMENLESVSTMHQHAGPDKFGVFAVVEHGLGYWNENFKSIINFTGITEPVFKANIGKQVDAVAAYIEHLCIVNQAEALHQAGSVVRAFCEIPDNSLINRYARELAVYEVFYQLTHGYEKNEVSYPPIDLRLQDWFDETYIPLLTASKVLVTENKITNGQETIAEQNAETWQGPLSTDYGPALWTTSPNYSSRNGSSITAVTVHTTQGSYAGAISWFQNTASQVSAHYVIRSTDGQITQMVREYNKAWHVGTENPYTIGIEHEGYVSQTGWYTTAMYNASSSLVKDICADNGIDPKTCYKGPSSSGVSVLSSSIKIKGHQHFPNQNHTDPGINWNWDTYYNLINPGTSSCAASTVLNESFISTSFANLNWNAVSTATGYTLQWRKSGNSSWNTVNLTNNYTTINGLLGQTNYQWQVRSKCGSVYSNYSAMKTFTTKGSCWDGNEPNNIYTTPSVYSFNSTYTYGKICGSGDVDFFKINTTSTRNISIKMENLPANYNIETYTGSGSYLTGSYSTGTKSESVTLYNKPAGSYLFRVYGATNSDYHYTKDYRLTVTLSNPTQANIRTDESFVHIQSYPNPFSHELIVSVNDYRDPVKLIITDFTGHTVFTTGFISGRKHYINSSSWVEGMYIISLQLQNGQIVGKQLVYKQ
jgi:N-acetyl-anhydromuramyl-L-alanine amidase AmpD